MRNFSTPISNAQDYSALYEARLSAQDHTTIDGTKLNDIASILRQDRANYHKFKKRDADDQSDEFFSSAKNRELIDRYFKNIYIDSPMSAKDKQAILNGTPLVRVSLTDGIKNEKFLSLEVLSEKAISDKDSWEHPDPITYNTLRAWHARGGLGKYHWPKVQKVDLNGDGKVEIFLGVMGYGRGMVYALFTERKGKWILLSADVEGSDHTIEPIPSKNNSWLEFRSHQPDGRGGLTRRIYAWDGKQYSEK